MHEVALTVAGPVAARRAYEHARLRAQRVAVAPVRQPQLAAAQSGKVQRLKPEDVVARDHDEVVLLSGPARMLVREHEPIEWPLRRG